MAFSGKLLKQLREEKELTQAEFGELIHEKMGYPNQHPPRQQYIDAWESGQRVPTAQYLIAIAIALNVSTDYLLGITNVRNHYQGDNLTKDQLQLLDFYASGDLEKLAKLFLRKKR